MAKRFGIDLWEQPIVGKLQSPSQDKLYEAFDFYHIQIGLGIDEPRGLKDLKFVIRFDEDHSSPWCMVHSYFPRSEMRESSIASAEIAIDAKLDFKTLSAVAVGSGVPVPVSGSARTNMSAGPFTFNSRQLLIHGAGINQRKVRWTLASRGMFEEGDIILHIVLRVADKRRKNLDVSVIADARGALGLNGRSKESASTKYRIKLDRAPVSSFSEPGT